MQKSARRKLKKPNFSADDAVIDAKQQLLRYKKQKERSLFCHRDGSKKSVRNGFRLNILTFLNNIIYE